MNATECEGTIGWHQAKIAAAHRRRLMILEDRELFALPMSDHERRQLDAVTDAEIAHHTAALTRYHHNNPITAANDDLAARQAAIRARQEQHQ